MSAILFIVFICQIYLGTYVLLKSKEVDRSTAFNFIMLAYSLALWVLSYYVSILKISYEVSLLAIRTTSVGSLFFPFYFLMFSFSVSGKKSNHINVKLLYGVFVILGLICLFTNLYIKGVNISGGEYDWFPGRYYNIIPLLLFLFMISGLYTLVCNYRNYNILKQNQIKYLFLGALISFSIGLIANIIMPLFDLRQLTYLGSIGTVVFTASSAYVITKHRLMDISVVISRTIAELLSISFLGSIYIGLVWLYRYYISAGIEIPFISWTIIYGIIVGQTHQRIRLFLQTTSDKVFLKGKYDYYNELAEISSQTTRSLSVDNIKKTLHKAFYEVLEVSNPRIYIEGDLKKFELKDYLAVRSPAFSNKDLILPCRVEERLIALIILGPKLSEDVYTDEDLRLLSNIANQTAVALDHHRMYEEMLKAQEQLLLAEKQSSMGRVAAGLAHEIKNPLAAIKGMTQSMKQDKNDPELMSDYCDVVPKEISRLKNLVDKLLKLGTANQSQYIKTDVSGLIVKIIKLYEQQCRSNNITVIKELNVIPDINAGPEQLTQVFTNLIVNAIQAMPNGGKLTVASNQSTEGNNVQVEISDTGQGIPADKLKDIFEPFFTTKTEGLGLGLAITYKIIKDHGGDIDVESKVGEGTRFKVGLHR